MIGPVTPRDVTHRYADPLDEIWIGAAQQLGLTIRRSDEAYAAYDGEGTLIIALTDLDADDSVAQMIFHELCHALVSGPGAMSRRDWGLEGLDASDALDATLEHACHRLQAALADRHGLRAFFSVTTDHRAHWDAMPAQPLVGDEPAAERARDAMIDATHGPWATTLEAALAATAQVCALARPWVDDGSLFSVSQPLHASGFPENPDASLRCAQCAWLFRSGPGPRVPRCRQSRHADDGSARRIEPEAQACNRFEPAFDEQACSGCGACCREGFHLVPVAPRDPIRRAHPELVTLDEHGAHLERPDGRCVALRGDGKSAHPFACHVYGLRPRACAEFEVAGDACLEARRRTGLSH